MNVTRLSLFGNSHLVAMKRGRDKLVDLADRVVQGSKITYSHDPDVMVEVRNGNLVLTSKEMRNPFVALAGTSHLNLPDDHVRPLVGPGVSFKHVLQLCLTCRWQGFAHHPALPLVSATFARSHRVEGYGATRLIAIGQKLATLAAKPFLALHEHLWSPRTTPCLGGRDFGWRSAADQRIDVCYATVFPQAMGKAALGKESRGSAVVAYGAIRPDLDAEVASDLLAIGTTGEAVDFLMRSNLRGLAVRWHPKIISVDELRKCKRYLKAAGLKVIAPVSPRMAWAITRDAQSRPDTAKKIRM